MKKVLKFLLKPRKQYSIALPFIDGWICDGDYWFQITSKTVSTSFFSGRRLNHGKILFTICSWR